MRAVRCHRFAALDKNDKPLLAPDPIRNVLQLEQVETPKLRNDGVLIETHFAGIQYPDFLQAQGLYQIKPKLPYIPGMDVVGIVLEKGIDVSHDSINVGDRVYGNTALCRHGGGGTGALAEIVSISASAVFPVPDILHMSSVANLGMSYYAFFFYS